MAMEVATREPSFPARVVNFYQEVVAEMRKVTCPDRKQLKDTTIKFVGHERMPQPLRPEEVNRLLGVADDSEPEEVKEEIPFLVGQAVSITEGPFTDFNGTVEEVLSDKGKVRVSVSLFGRPTSVELDYLQLKGY